jgi:phosphoglucomutase
VESEVRDKDGVSAAMLCAEMALYWARQGKGLLERLDELYAECGYFEDLYLVKSFPGKEGEDVIKGIMEKLRADTPVKLGGAKVIRVRDLLHGDKSDPLFPLPASNVLQFYLENGVRVSVRPSGTEPKIKFYVSVCSEMGDGGLREAKALSAKKLAAVKADISAMIDSLQEVARNTT